MEVSVLTSANIRTIHETSLRILDDVGIVLPHKETLERFKACGARVDFSNERVRIPPELVMQSVRSCGKQFAIYGRDGEKCASFGTGHRNYNSIAGEALWLDHDTGARRYPTLADVGQAARLCDALPNITIAGAMADPSDIPVSYRCVAVAAEILCNTEKPVALWFHDRASAAYLVELAIALRGDADRAQSHPPYYPFLEPISPLHFPFNGVDLLYETARLNLPVPIGPMAQMGISAPGTLAATMVQENAEILAGVCITQIVREGMPVCYGGICHAFDMRTTQMIFSGPEQAIFGVAMTQMGKHYGLPVYINVGLTDSKRPDGQAGLESGVTLAFGAAAGADIFGHMGICGVDQAASLNMLVFQNEVIGYVESCMRSIDFSDDALGFNEIAEVGPRGSYIDREFTAGHFRNELWFPALLDREFYDAWYDNGGHSVEDAVFDETASLVEHHKPVPVPDELGREIDAVVSAAERHLHLSS